MRISKFTQASARYQKQSGFTCLFPMGIALVCVLIYAPFLRPLEEFYVSKYGSTTADALAAFPMVLFTILALASIIPLARRVERKYGVGCPHCGKNLADYKSIVIASKNCPHCGSKVLEDDPDATAENLR